MIYSNISKKKSIAVLPFVNLSADIENEYFSDGMTEEIINALTKIQGLKVIARTSSFAFKGKNEDVRSIGKQLGVSTLLEGSIRKYKNRVRITAQLINALDGTHYWSQNFDRELEDIFLLQDEISHLIADQIRENSGHFYIQDHLVNESTKNVKAYELFLKGRYHQLKWNPESIRKAIEYYDASVASDSQFARAYYGNLQCYGLLSAWGYMPAEEGFAKAIENFKKGSAIDTDFPEYTHSLTSRSFWGEWNFNLAHEQILQTLKINPNYTDAIEAMAELCIATGYFKQAEEYAQRAIGIDPLCANHYYTLGNISYLQRKFETAILHLDRSMQLNQELELAIDLKLKCLIWLNRKADFKELLKEKKQVEHQNMLFEIVNGEDKELPKELLMEWREVDRLEKQLVPNELFILSNSNHLDVAMELLESYVAKKRGQIINFRHEPFLQNLHQFDQFHKLHQLNFSLQEVNKSQVKGTNRENKNVAELNLQMQSLLQHLNEKKTYLDSQLSLNNLAGFIQIHPNKLSFLINEKTGMNFNEFINQYRLSYFKEIAVNTEFTHLSILGMAYESGFSSKTVFNAFFKKKEGKTPSLWLKETKANNLK